MHSLFPPPAEGAEGSFSAKSYLVPAPAGPPQSLRDSSPCEGEQNNQRPPRGRGLGGVSAGGFGVTGSALDDVDALEGWDGVLDGELELVEIGAFLRRYGDGTDPKLFVHRVEDVLQRLFERVGLVDDGQGWSLIDTEVA